MRRVMLVDDEKNVLHSLQRSLRKLNQEKELILELFSSPLEAIKRLGEVQFHIVISDYHMPEMSGTDFLKLTMAMQPKAIRLMLSASAEFQTVLGAVNEAEVFRYIEKPWDIMGLEEIIELSLAQYERAEAPKKWADNAGAQVNTLTPQEIEAKRLEQEEPGITKVNWGPDGSVLLD